LAAIFTAAAAAAVAVAFAARTTRASYLFFSRTRTAVCNVIYLFSEISFSINKNYMTL